MDSLGRVSLIASIEDRFGVVITEQQMDDLSTLEKLSNYVESNSSKSTSEHVSWKDIFEHSDENIKIPHSGIIHYLMFFFMKFVFHVFYIFKSSGVDNVPDQPCIFVGNHRSGFDGAFITSKLKWRSMKRTFFFAKDKHFSGSFTQFMAKRNNIILMDINSNVRNSLEQMYQVLKKGNNIVIFPEGTRSKDGKLQEFKESFAILSQALNIPVIPVAIEGAEGATYKSIRIPRFLTKIKVQFLPAQYPSPTQTAKEFKEQIKNSINNALTRIK